MPGRRLALVFAAAAALAGAAAWIALVPASRPAPADEGAVRALCSRCHAFAPPEALPRHAWRESVAQMFRLAGLAGPDGGPAVPVGSLTPEAVADWFEARAPERLDLPPGPAVAAGGLAARLRRRPEGLAPKDAPPLPGTANVRLLDLLGDGRLEAIVCDARTGLVLVGKPYDSGRPELQMVAKVPAPAHAAVCDLDGDGRRDLVVADLGTLKPADHEQGRVLWLRRAESGAFEEVVLRAGLGRVAAVEPADLDRDGDLDLVVAEFGWRASGRLVVLENRGGAPPAFALRVLDERHGAIAAPTADLDRDGLPDIVALLAQEHERVVALLNRGALSFERRELWRAPHPAWGSTSLSLVDLDADGDLDALAANGDTLDDYNLKPYHGVTWLENPGGSGGPAAFAARPLAALPGAHRAEAADLDGDGDLDIVACSFLPHLARELRAPLRIASLLAIEQTARGVFEPRALETLGSDHPSLSTGDMDLDGRPDVLVGNMTISEPRAGDPRAWVDVWEGVR